MDHREIERELTLVQQWGLPSCQYPIRASPLFRYRLPKPVIRPSLNSPSYFSHQTSILTKSSKAQLQLRSPFPSIFPFLNSPEYTLFPFCIRMPQPWNFSSKVQPPYSQPQERTRFIVFLFRTGSGSAIVKASMLGFGVGGLRWVENFVSIYLKLDMFSCAF